MRRTILLSAMTVLVLCLTLPLITRTPATLAQSPAPSSGYFAWDLCGNYASQLSGTLNYPAGHPLAGMNGSYALTGVVSADCQGNASGTIFDNYNGMLVKYSWQGTYSVNLDGTVLIHVAASVPGLGKLALDMFGVICDGGNQVRLMHVGPFPNIPGKPPNFLGTTIIGNWIRQ